MNISQTILEQIKFGTSNSGHTGQHLMMCWGASLFMSMTNGLCFKVRGARLKGKVLVSLNKATDLYDIQFYSFKGELFDKVSDVYAEDLVEMIDCVVETQKDNYKFMEDKFYA